MLTRKQLDLLRFIQQRMRETGVPPSFDEMKDALDLKSKSGIHRLITALEERGFLRRMEKRARALEVTRLPENMAEGVRPAATRNQAQRLSRVESLRGPRGGDSRDLRMESQNRIPADTRQAASYLRNRGHDAESVTAVPILGRIAAGTPIEALQNRVADVPVPGTLIGGGEHYALEVSGDSMIEAGILDGDFALIRRTDTARDGEIVVALVRGEEATLKYLHRDKGGVRLAKSVEEVKTFVNQMLGKTLVTIQTGPEGQKVRRLLIEEGADIKKELYVGMVVDRGTQRVCLMASSEGGMDIEEVAAHTPEKIHKVFVDPGTGLKDAEADDIARKIGVPEASVGKARVILQGLYHAFDETDASLAEINPLILTGGGDVIALDAKFNFDDNALFRHPDIFAMRDLDEEDPYEVQASKFDLNYISLDGNIGCLVNGAGLAMATMDIIKLYGLEPANFLDVGGSATKDKVAAAFKIITSDPKVKGILVNIFGGIMKCDVIAEGVVAAVKEVGLKVPLVVRLEGTNVELVQVESPDRLRILIWERGVGPTQSSGTGTCASAELSQP